MSEQPAGETLSSSILLREIKPGDAAEVRRVYKDAWLQTYPNDEHGITREDILEKVKDWDSAESIAKLEDQILNGEKNENEHNVCAIVGDKVVGNSRSYRVTSGELHNGAPFNKLQTMYIHPDFQGRGVAQVLFENVLDWLGNGRQILLEVAIYNSRAISFYEKYGFKVVGRSRTTEAAKLPSGKELPEYLMVRPAVDNDTPE